jgi:hypothetical protein
MRPHSGQGNGLGNPWPNPRDAKGRGATGAIQDLRLSEIIKEDNGKISFARAFSALIIVIMLGLIVFETLKGGKIPELGGPTLFLTGSVASLYGSNKIASAITGKPST